MFNADFYPTPLEIIEAMTASIILKNKTILEPSAGSGNIIDYLKSQGATVICCENDPKLKIIAESKAKLIKEDFLKVQSDEVSHINAIVMNPPFSDGARHLLHAYEIAPKGCKIVCLLNAETVNNTYSNTRRELKSIIDLYGNFRNLENCFTDAERQTNVKVVLVEIQKGIEENTEFEGFFLEDDEEERQENALMSYNVVRDLVNRYVAAVKLYDEQLTTGQKMNNLLSNFYGNDLAFNCTKDKAVLLRNDFKKDLQKSGWSFIFNKMNLYKYSTKGLRDDLNKFVEQQIHIPFTMKNIYKMLDVIIFTNDQRMDKAILEAFDNITLHHDENRHNVKGWKTNSHYLVGKKFILPNCVSPAKEYGFINSSYNYLSSYKSGVIEDLEKALCFVSGDNYDKIKTIQSTINRNTYGEWYESHFFKYKSFKNGNMHFEFNTEDVWALFNQRVSKLKGYPLFEAKEQTNYQKKQTGRTESKPMVTNQNNILFEIEL